MINYRSLADLTATIKRNLHRIPHDIDIIVGIPRSGLLAANILALDLQLPLTDVDGLLSGRLLGGGRRMTGLGTTIDTSQPQKILVLDDSINTGNELGQTKAKIAHANLPHKFIYAAVYSTPESQNLVDLAFEVVPIPRLFEWNIMHHSILAKSCVDIDGVLCRDPTEEENDDGPKYLNFLKNVPPLFLPRKPIGWLVTCRLEKYRALTEEWLHRHGIVYSNLIMMDLPSKAARIASGSHASFKAGIFKQTKAKLFIESSEKQALEIAIRAGKDVFCLETGKMFSISSETDFEDPKLQEMTRQIEMCRRVIDIFDQKARRLANELSEIKNSRSWKLVSRLRQLRSLVTSNSNRKKISSPQTIKPQTHIRPQNTLSEGCRNLEIGPGEKRLEGFETLNIVPGPDVDYVLDATKLLPFEDNTFDLIYASHILEHVPWYQLEAVLAEWVRILKKGGKLEIWVPDGLKICKAFVDAELHNKNYTHLDGWYRYNPEKDCCKWAAGRIFSYGDGTGKADSPNWHRALFSERYLTHLLTNVRLQDIRKMAPHEVRGHNHGWINLGITGRKPLN